MKKRYYLGLDQGTTGTTAIVFDETWNVRGKGYAEHKQYYPQPGWVEHDPLEIWEKVQQTIHAALKDAGVAAGEVRAIGLDNQGETCMAWDRKTGEPVCNAIVWQDRRTANAADELAADWGEEIRGRTGVPVDAYFSALKIRWILDNVEGARQKAEKGELRAGTTDAWLMWKLTGGEVCATDPSTASRTMLFNIHERKWDSTILDKIGIPDRILPEIRDSVSVFGRTSPKGFMGAGIPVAGSVVDQAAALFGQACYEKGAVKTTYGTGCFMLMNTGTGPVASKGGLLTTVAWRIRNQVTFALDGGVYIAGAAIQWCRDGIKILSSAAESEAMAESVPDTGGVYFVPAFVGLAAPYWDQYARGMIIGITGGTTRAHIVRATLEAIAFQVAENLEVMRRDSGAEIDVMRVDGGATVNRFLMQFQADLLGIPVDVPLINETTAYGVALMASMGMGDFKDLDEIAGRWKLARRYEPRLPEDKRKAAIEKWRRAVARCRNWAE